MVLLPCLCLGPAQQPELDTAWSRLKDFTLKEFKGVAQDVLASEAERQHLRDALLVRQVASPASVCVARHAGARTRAHGMQQHRAERVHANTGDPHALRPF